ncbi:TonB-dependent receptor [Granulicella sibirica]|uniref:TonB-dependent receptor n=1 Tax=Granulicella sibirica TaxID=2479048 RepID=UPI00240D0178|nr:carboxypeptidase-like regulatory domain-containing protein [Granulicella sibirica]
MVGTVNDKTGASVANTKVTATDLATNTPHTATTNDSGNYSIPDLQPGLYSITVEAAGFSRETRPSVDIVVNTTTRIDFSLSPGAVTDTITVTDTVPVMQTDRADISTKLEAEKMENLPIGVNRNFQSLLNLVPGTTPASFQHSQFFNAQSSLQTEVNGTPRMGNSYQIEGIDDDERTGLLQIMIPPADAIATVDVSTNNFEAELGRAIGAVTNVTLKSGANKFHGSASEYLQNSDLNARSYFASSVGHLAYNYFGGNISGPIFRNKLFFYGDYFRTSDHEANANTMTIPFQKYYTPNAAGFVDLSDLLNTTTGKGQIYDPATGNPLTGAGRTPFAGNLIPYSRVNPVSIALLKLLPAPNTNATTLSSPSNNYFATLPFQKASDTYDAKIDYQLSSKDHLSYRYGYQKSNVFQAPVFGSVGGGPANGAFAGTGIQNAYSTGLNYDRAFSSTLLTEVRVGVAHYRSSATPTDYGSNDATNIGIPGVNINPFTSGQVGISLGSFSSPIIGYSASVPWVRGETNIDVVNHWTKIIGNHTIKFGGDLRRIRDELLQDQTFSPRGVITFGENQTSIPGGSTNAANDMASMLLDVPSGVGRDINTFTPDLRAWWIFSFAGDKWQATSKLTVDYGVRWEIYPPMTPAHPSGFSNYIPTNNTLVLAGVGGNPSNMGLKNHYGYFAPRTGFAYRATEGTVIRGGFGISYTPFPDNSYAYNYPVRANNQYSTCNSGYQAAVYTCTNNVAGAIVTYQAGFPAPVAVPIPSNGIITATGNAQLTSQSYNYIPLNYQNPYVESWNMAIQQALPGQFSMQLAYVANHGVHIATAQNINLGDRLNCGTACYPGVVAGFSRTAGTTEYFIGNSSNYQSLQLQISRRLTNGLSSTSAFTWGKGLGYQGGDDGGYSFSLQTRRNYAPNDYDRRLNFEQSATYELPFGPGKRFLHDGILAHTIGGWKLSGILSLVTGTPFTVTANGGNINTGGETQTANLSGVYRVLHGIGSGHNWFDPTQFSQPAGCAGYATATPTTVTCPLIAGQTIGNLGRNTFYGPGFIQDNLSLFKTFSLYEGFTLDVRADAFQLSNTPQFANPSASLTSTTFGQITGVVGSGTGANGVGGGRSLQLAAILKF